MDVGEGIVGAAVLGGASGLSGLTVPFSFFVLFMTSSRA